MATVLEEYITEELLSVILFLWTKGRKAKDIHKETFPVYGGKCVSSKSFHDCVEKFSEGSSNVADEAAIEATVQRVEEFVRDDTRTTIYSVATARGCLMV
jgi:hypothetical protein